MINDNEPVSILVDLGLTILQAKIYLTLLTQELQTAKTISNISKVSKPDVYRIIAQLEELKLVERIEGKPATFQAIPLEVCTSILIQNKVKKLSKVKKRIPILLEQISEMMVENQIEPRNDFTIIPKESFHNRSKMMIMNAKKSIFSIIPTEEVVLPPDEYTIILNEALTRNIDVRTIMCYPSNEKYENKILMRETLFKNFQVRYVQEKPIVAIGIFDGEEVLINTQPNENFNSSALLSRNKNILSLCEFYFNNLWKSIG